MKRLMISMGTLVAAIALLAGCAIGADSGPSDLNAAMAAGAVLDFVASEGYEQVQELEVAQDAYDLSGGGSRAITTETTVHEYPNVTVTIIRELDDRDTPEPTDDILTVSRTYDYGFEANYIHVLVRPLKPTTDVAWDSYDTGDGPQGWTVVPVDEIDQEGTISRALGSVAVANGTVAATWVRDGSDVYAGELVREVTDLVRTALVRRTIITQDAAGETSLRYEREVDGVVVHSYTVEPWTDPDTGYTHPRVVRDDGSYAVVLAKGNRSGAPRIVDYYDANDVRLMTVEEVRSGARGIITSTRTHYDATGAITGVGTVTYAVNYTEGDEDTVQITRVANGVTRSVVITESGDVYLVTVGGESYRARVVDANTVEFLDDAGSVVMTATRTPDGRWVLDRGGEQVTI